MYFRFLHSNNQSPMESTNYQADALTRAEQNDEVYQESSSNAKAESPYEKERRSDSDLTQFPVTITTGMEVQSSVAIMTLLEEEAKEREMGQFVQFYRINHRPNMNDPKYIYFNCSKCKAGFSITKQALTGNFKVGKVHQNHDHNLRAPNKDRRQLSNIKEENDENQELEPKEKKYLDMFSRPRKIRQKSGSRKSSVKYILQKVPNWTDIILKRKNPQHNLNSFPEVQKFLRNEQCDYLVDWSEKDTKNPEILLVVSPNMKKSYEKYGDQLYLNVIFKHRLVLKEPPNSYMFAIFVAFDSNNRPLIVGTGIISSKKSTKVKILLEMFFSIHRSRPKSIITNDDSEMVDAISVLKRKKIYFGAHLLNPTSVVKNIQKTIQESDPKQLQTVVDFVKSLINTKYKFQAETLISSFTLENKAIENSIMIILQDKAPSLFRYKMDLTFVNFNLNITQLIDTIAQNRIQNAKNTVDLFEKIFSTQKELQNYSASNYEQLTTPIEEYFKDYRLKQIRNSLEKCVAERFFENYLEGLREYTVQKSDQQASTVKHKESNSIFLVINSCSTCNCGETVKTGIPCPHLLLCSRKYPNMNLKNLISKRWIRQVNEDLKIKQIDKIQAESDASSSRSNI